jgi:hypothetical protein
MRIGSPSFREILEKGFARTPRAPSGAAAPAPRFPTKGWRPCELKNKDAFCYESSILFALRGARSTVVNVSGCWRGKLDEFTQR